jgi:hypothetical protein
MITLSLNIWGQLKFEYEYHYQFVHRIGLTYGEDKYIHEIHKAQILIWRGTRPSDPHLGETIHEITIMK